MKTRKSTGYRDSNGNEILEGDIIYDKHFAGRGKKKHYYEVVFRNNRPGMERICDRNTFIDFEHFTFTSEYVIGNKFDNPKLLE